VAADDRFLQEDAAILTTITATRKRLGATIVRRNAPALFCAVAVLAAVMGTPAQTRAQGYISPFIGFDFGGDSGCPEISGCEDKRLNAGVALGTMGLVLGFEFEFGYANDFFGEIPGVDSSVLTAMGNVMFIPAIGPVRPYALVGLGLIKSHVELTPANLLTSDNNDLGWDIGGGLLVLFGDHLGVRGDIRYFHAFQDLEILGLPLGDTKLDFSRASAALVLAF
jgi:opacity protein-like surface antigen